MILSLVLFAAGFAAGYLYGPRVVAAVRRFLKGPPQ